MRLLLVCLIALSCAPFVVGQKPLSGIFEYKASISLPDTNVILKEWNVRVFTNDTIVRVETETQLGIQVYIRHMELNKAYLLIDYGTEKYAIQTNLDNQPKIDTLKPDYTIKRKFGTKKVAGIKCRKYYIQIDNQPEGFYSYFAKKISNKYLEVYKNIPGLGLDYYLPSPDGLIHYELKQLTITPVDSNLFGVPSDYKRITFDEFVNLFSE